MLEVIYEDNHQLVVNKPAGMLTQPNDTADLSLECIAKEWIKKTKQKEGNVYLHAIHRLDRPVRGIVLFAKTSKALSRLQAAMRDKKCRKFYVGYVEGCLKQKNGELQHYLFHDEHHAVVCSERHPEAKLAKLHYETLEEKNDSSILKIELLTGRYHQIRVQFAELGHPIIGDVKYGSARQFAPGQIALMHQRLEIPHPITGEQQIFEIKIS